MKRIIKNRKSEVLKNNLQYSKSRQRKQIRQILKIEQEYFCAYTEERLTSAFSIDIEHFNPRLKKTSKDSYYNWFVISCIFNRYKSNKYKLPIIHPTDFDIEKRIIYEKGYYKAFNETDEAAHNTIDLLSLNRIDIVDDRINYIESLKFLYENMSKTKFKEYLEKFPDKIKFRRAIETEFHIKL